MRGLLLLGLLAGCGLTLDLTPPVGDAGVIPGEDTGPRRDAGMDAIPPDAPSCVSDEECAGLVRAEPPTTCGDFRCQDGFCLANDVDGDGFGPGCEDERDCDDTNPSVNIDGAIPCPDALGICGESATLACVDGMWADDCEGVQEPQMETCNNVDDDCDGRTDEEIEGRIEGVPPCERTYSCAGGTWDVSMPPARAEVCGDEIDDDCDGTVNDPECASDCVYVSPVTTGLPVGSITATDLDSALTSGDGSRQFCLVSNTESGNCVDTPFPLATDLPSGTVIIGGFRRGPAGGVIERCARPHTTRIVPRETRRETVVAAGDAQLIALSVSHPARPDGTAVAATSGTTTMVSVEVVGGDDGAPERTTGIRVDPAANLFAYETNVDWYGVTSVGIEAFGNVALFQGCTGDCSCDETARSGIWGRGGEGAGVVVRDGNFVAENYLVCSQSSSALMLDQAGAFVAGSTIESLGGDRAIFAPCERGDGIWVHDTVITTRDVNDSAVVTGMEVLGNCGVLLTNNVITGLIGGRAGNVVGFSSDGAEAALTQNDILGFADAEVRDNAFGVLCKSSAGPGNCRLITNNFIQGTLEGGIAPLLSFGLDIGDSTFSYLEQNFITAGCATSSATGLLANSSVLTGRANQVTGLLCDTTGDGGAHFGMNITNGGVTWNGNTMLGGASSIDHVCEVFGGSIDGRAVLRNNLFVGGDGCDYSVGLEAFDVRARILMFYNGFTLADDLLLLEAGDLRAYADSDTLLADFPLFVGHLFDPSVGIRNFTEYPGVLKLTRSSPFVGAGASPAGPTIEGSAHAVPPSIGAWEP